MAVQNATIVAVVGEGSAEVSWKKEEVRGRVKTSIWKPVYGEYVYDENGAR